MISIEVLVGMIGSGKSTYARSRAGEGALVICHDDLTAMLHAHGPTSDGRGYDPDLRECYRGMEEDLARRVLSFDRGLVIDGTHLTAESRGRWVVFARACGVPCVAVTFPVEAAVIHARRRHEADPRGRSWAGWLAVAHRDLRRAEAEPLSPGEGFAEIRRVSNPWSSEGGASGPDAPGGRA